MLDRFRFGSIVAASLMVYGGSSTDVRGQYDGPDIFDVNVSIDSGFVRNTGHERAVIYSTLVQAQDAAWMRVVMDEAHLGAAPVGGQPTVMRITSVLDGAVQHLDAKRLAQWANTTAYFNGNTLLVELVSDAGAEASRVRSTTARIGPVVPAEPVEDSICFSVDDRELSFDDRTGRLMPVECTAWIIDDPNHCFLTAGHCTFNVDSMQFNVPLSTPGGQVQHPPPSDQYPIDPVSMQSNGGQGIGNDWAYFGCFENSETGLTPVEAQGAFFVLADVAPPVTGQDIRITGYGSTSSPVSPTWHKVQKTHTGPFIDSSGTTVEYQTDTTGGNSGSPVIDESTGLAIGIHTHGGCNSGGGDNNGTAIQNTGLQNALANPTGICAAVPSLDFTFPQGLPAELSGNGTSFFVTIDGQFGAQLEPGTGLLHYDDGTGVVTAPLVPQVGNLFQAIFPSMTCDATVQYYVSAETTDEELITNPASAPLATYEAPVVCPAIPGDIDGDGDVDFADILDLIAAWGPCPAPPAECPADVDGNGDVGFSDVLEVIANWS